MHATKLFSLLAALPAAMACLGYTGGVPKATDTVHYKSAYIVKKGEVFDGKWKRYDRGIKCTGQKEGGEKDTVFILEDGATVRNVIIGADQIEGIHCRGSCNVEFAWFEDISSGGGAYTAADKIIQHNDCGHISVINFHAEDYGKVYRSCRNCKGNSNYKHSVHMEGVTAQKGGELIGINSSLGDRATYSNNCFPKTQCQGYNCCEPKKSKTC